MASTRLREAYLRERRRGGGGIVGESALWALRDARTRLKWAALEDAGFVRLTVDDDPDPDLSWIDQDCFDDRYRDDVRRAIDQDGVWGLIGEYTTNPDDNCPDWTSADAVWGNIGYADPRETCHTTTIMRETIEAFVSARKLAVRQDADRKAGRCPKCHGTGRLA